MNDGLGVCSTLMTIWLGNAQGPTKGNTEKKPGI